MEQQNKPTIVLMSLTGALKEIKRFFNEYGGTILGSIYLIGLGYSLHYPHHLFMSIISMGIYLVIYFSVKFLIKTINRRIKKG
ncbi:hypothetical protein QJU93_09830 [Pasteurella skyensis]|uniref:Uncharacterized protein n=1 Tax=Phocoenobacter skyensis TaxID=97481 RepID=A0AAJ6NBA3_9PAST|nr:hypothetical protein [Pasteurella skyensis]MDP8173653.1 hypothetical protein [Pasteurella skyensis]MDP8178021.1 hypothetical protein [Pasteurella skyensis]